MLQHIHPCNPDNILDLILSNDSDLHDVHNVLLHLVAAIIQLLTSLSPLFPNDPVQSWKYWTVAWFWNSELYIYDWSAADYHAINDYY